MSTFNKLVLQHRRSFGDIVCMTALVRDIKLTYPDLQLDLNTTCKEIWENNPYITQTPLWNHNSKNPVITVPGTRFIKCNYGQGIKDQKKETIHFVSYFHRDFENRTGLKVPLTLPHGDLHLSEAEKVRPIKQRYWMIMSGGKSDFTIKVWHTPYFQQVVNTLRGHGIEFVQNGDNGIGHWHPKLDGTLDIRGKPSLRDVIRLIYHCDGIICGVTGAMHTAAAFGKPCVCIAGGREAWWWEAYVRENAGLGGLDTAAKLKMPHRFLHTIGLLDCCQHHGCWRNKVVKISDDASVCKYPVHTPTLPVAKCMLMIKPEHVIEAVMSYYQDKSLPPIDVRPDTGVNRAVVIDNHIAPSPLTLTPGTVFNTSAHQATRQIRVVPGAAATLATDIAVMGNSSVGGKFTVFMLFYGDERYHELHRRCLETFLATTPPECIDLRVGSNALHQKSVDMLELAVNRGQITKHYRHINNDMKYPVMREMFFDPACPVKTKWVIWFDDDTICDKNPDWLTLLSQQIAHHHQHNNNHMFGDRYTWTLQPRQREILQSRHWYTGKHWQNSGGKTVPGGNKITFATGGFWAITYEAIIKCDIPDLSTGLTHNGGDWQIGCQLYQQGYSIKQFNKNKQLVNTSSVPRRGITAPLIDSPVVKQQPVQTQPVLIQPITPEVIVVQQPQTVVNIPSLIRI